MKKNSNIIFFLSALFISFVNILNAQDKSEIEFEDIKYRNVGPTRGGRSTTVCGVINEQFTFYMGTTGGGVWKTLDGGLSWKNISDGYFKTPSIGSIDIFQADPSIIYVGTGSDGIRSNVIIGKGVYKSNDAGSSWEYIGLENSGQIGAIKVHPKNPNIVYAAAIGQPFNSNIERGLFKSSDAGKSWSKILFISDKIGIVDVEFSPENPDIIYAASWKVDRKPWTIISGSERGGIYKSIDGGSNWNLVFGRGQSTTVTTTFSVGITRVEGYFAVNDIILYDHDNNAGTDAQVFAAIGTTWHSRSLSTGLFDPVLFVRTNGRGDGGNDPSSLVVLFIFSLSSPPVVV